MAGLEQRISERLFARLEGEYREHPANSLRSGPDHALYLTIEAVWEDCFGEGWTLRLRGENLTEEDFQPIPGTPGSGREASLTVSYAW